MRQTIAVNENRSYEVNVKAKPRAIQIDPDFEVFRRLERREIPPSFNSVFGDPDALLVLPTGGDEQTQQACKALAEALSSSGRAKFTVKSDADLSDAEFKSHSLYILGGPANKLFSRVKLPEKTAFDAKSIQLLGKEYSGDFTAALALRHPADPTKSIVIVAATNPQSLAPAGGKIVHYGKYGYLVFEASKNVVKGSWDVDSSPLRKSLTAKTVDPAPRRVDPDLEIGKNKVARFTYASGLRLLVLEDHSAPHFTLFLAYGCGTANETLDTSGLAHLTEHAMYTGSANVKPGEHDQTIKKLGAEPNAYTRTDYTLYYSYKVPPKDLETAVKMEAQRMRGLTFPSEAFEFERKRLIDEEVRTYKGLSEYFKYMSFLAFTEHPYRVGYAFEPNHTTRARHLSIEDSKKFYDTYYQPNNAVMVLLGDIKTDDAARLVGEAFAAMEPSDNIPAVNIVEKPQIRERIAAMETSDKSSYVLIGYHLPAYDHPDHLAAQVLAEMVESMGNGKIHTFEETLRYPDVMTIFSECPGDQLPQTERAIHDAVDKIARGDFPTDKFTAAREKVGSAFKNMPAQARPYQSIGAELAVHELIGSAQFVCDFESRVGKISAEDVQKAAAKYFVASNRTVLYCHGNGAAAGGHGAAPQLLVPTTKPASVPAH